MSQTNPIEPEWKRPDGLNIDEHCTCNFIIDKPCPYHEPTPSKEPTDTLITDTRKKSSTAEVPLTTATPLPEELDTKEIVERLVAWYEGGGNTLSPDDAEAALSANVKREVAKARLDEVTNFPIDKRFPEQFDYIAERIAELQAEVDGK